MLKPNGLHIKSVSFHYSDAGIRLSLKKDSVVYDLNFQTGKWQPGETNMPGPNLLLGDKEDISFLQPYKIAGSYTSPDDIPCSLNYGIWKARTPKPLPAILIKTATR